MRPLSSYGLAALADDELELRREQTPETRELAVAARVWLEIDPPDPSSDPVLRAVQIRVVLHRLEISRARLAGWIGLHRVPWARNLDELLERLPHRLLLCLFDCLACDAWAAELAEHPVARPCPVTDFGPGPALGSRFD